MNVRHEVVVEVAYVNILYPCTTIDAVLLEIITSACTQRHRRWHIGLFVVSYSCLQHDVVFQEVTGSALNAEVTFLVAAISQVESRERGIEIHFLLFKLCIGGERHK